MQAKESSEDLNLHKYWLVLKRRWLPATSVFIAVSALSVLSVSFEDPTYRASGSLLFRVNRTPSLTGIEGDLGQLDALVFGGNPLETQAEIIRSLSVAKAVIEELDLKTDSGEPLSPVGLVSSLQVSGVSETADILRVSYTSDKPEAAAAVVNQVMQEYITANLLDNRAEAASAREFIESNLPGSEAAVRAAERDLQQFKERNRIVALEQEADAVVDTLKGLDQQIVSVRAQLIDTTTRSNELSTQLGLDSRQSIALTALGQSSGVQELLTELQTVQTELASERTRYRSNHPTIVALERREVALIDLLQDRVSQVAGIDTQIEPGRLQVGELQENLTENLVNLEIERLGLAQQLEELARTREGYVSRASVFPDLEQTQGRLERDLENAISNYEDLLTRLQDVQIAENQNLGNAKIIEEAVVPAAPIPNKNSLIWAVGAMCGILLGVAVAFVLDLVDRSIKTVQDAQSILRYPLVGFIPEFVEGHSGLFSFGSGATSYPPVPVIDSPHGPTHEAFQILQSNLKSSRAKGVAKVILLASATPEEGTSTIVANLAATIAQTRKRVLLIDANLAHPVQHLIWEVKNSFGLSDLVHRQLMQDSVDWREAVQPVMPEFSILSAGQKAVNSLDAFDSREMAEFISQAAQAYDFVLIDAPPLARSADASVLSQLVDGLVLVVNPKKATIESLEAAKELFTRLEQPVLGFVANRVESKEEAEDSKLRMTLWNSGSANKRLTSSVES